MKEIGATIEIVVKVSDEVYDKYIDDADGTCDLHLLLDHCLGVTIIDAELDWYEICYPEEI